ncbi:MAG: helix-hairpin-helix domain-containing protein [Gemmatimonadota bacterium]
MTTSDLLLELRRFAQDHPQGWAHDEWLGLLNDLGNAGHDLSDCDSVGLALEGERLSQTLQRMEVKGLGPKRIHAIVSHFGTLWNLMTATPEEVSLLPNVPRSLAGEILDILQ